MNGTMPLLRLHGILAWTHITFTRFLLYADFKVLRLLHTYYNIITIVYNSIRLHSLHMGNFISVASVRLRRSLYHGGLSFASILLLYA
jgi:hypothetical protein